MKLNEKGQALADKWYDIWRREIDRLLAEDPDAETGWGILETDQFEKNIDDCIGIALMGDDDDAIYHILEWYRPDDPYAFGYTAAEVVDMMKPYFDFNGNEDLSFEGE